MISDEPNMKRLQIIASSTTPTTHHSLQGRPLGFTDLPGEIRQQIYNYLLPEIVHLQVGYDKLLPTFAPQITKAGWCYNLLRTCKLISSELQPSLWATVDIVVYTPQELQEFTNLYPNLARNLRRVLLRSSDPTTHQAYNPTERDSSLACLGGMESLAHLTVYGTFRFTFGQCTGDSNVQRNALPAGDVSRLRKMQRFLPWMVPTCWEDQEGTGRARDHMFIRFTKQSLPVGKHFVLLDLEAEAALSREVIRCGRYQEWQVVTQGQPVVHDVDALFNGLPVDVIICSAALLLLTVACGGVYLQMDDE